MNDIGDGEFTSENLHENFRIPINVDGQWKSKKTCSKFEVIKTALWLVQGDKTEHKITLGLDRLVQES